MDSRWEIFNCQRCGKCCAEIGLPWDPNRISEIAEFLDLSVDQVIERYYGTLVDDGQCWESDDNKRTPCPFLEFSPEGKRCAIYPVRPEGCSLYPFETDFGRQGVDCPGAREVFESEKQIAEGDNVMLAKTIDVKIVRPEPGDLPGPPRAYIYVGNWGQASDHPDLKDLPVISPTCVTYREVECEVQRLKHCLDLVLKEAKRKFGK